MEILGRIFDNKVTGEETVLGRKAWRMESEPRAGYKPADRQEEEALASRRVNWFDEEDGFAIRATSLFIRPANGFQPGTAIGVELLKVGEEWLPDSQAIRSDMKIMAGIHGRVDSRQHYYDYKRFTVDTTVTPQ